MLRVIVNLYRKLNRTRDSNADPAKWREVQVWALFISTLTTKIITMLIEGGIFIDNFILHGIANSIAELLYTAGDPDYTGESALRCLYCSYLLSCYLCGH